MNDLLDSLWRSTAYCLHPRVIALSLAPLVITAALALGLGYFFWTPSVLAMQGTLQGWSIVQWFVDGLAVIGFAGLRDMLAPLMVLALALPLLIIFSLLLVSVMMVPALVKLVANRRFPQLERLHGGSLWQSVLYSTASTLGALVLLVLSLPLWLVPPMVLVLPPLIWGWLTYRVMSFDTLAEHASPAERRTLMRRHKLPLLGMGVVCGYLGAVPALVWSLGIATVVFAPVLVLVSVWLYTLVFAFSALWFAHYLLDALARLRASEGSGLPASAAAGEPPRLTSASDPRFTS